MTVTEMLKPVQALFDWMRTYHMNLYGFEFSFMDLFVWTMLATIVIWFIKNLID